MHWACDAMLLLSIHIGDVSPDKIRIYNTSLEEETQYVILDTVDNKTVRRIAISDFHFADHSGAHTLH